MVSVAGWLVAVALASSAVLRDAAALDIKWSQYSDRATLPRSQLWRDEMRARLRTLDTSKLSQSDRNHVRKLRRMLAEDEAMVNDAPSSWASASDAASPPVGLLGAIVPLLLLVGAAAFAYRRFAEAQRAARLAPRPASRPDVRRQRMQRFGPGAQLYAR